MAGNKIIEGGSYHENIPSNRIKAKQTNAPHKGKTLEAQYIAMKGKRETFLSRAKRLSKLTLPALFNESEANPTSDQGEGYTQNGWQSLGAQGHNHLSNKLVMTWFPPQRSFFRMVFTEEAKKALYNANISETTFMQQLSAAEQRCKLYHEEIQGQLAWTQAAKHLIASGNAMLYAPAGDNLVCYPMDRYVTKRAKSGRVLCMILEEEKALSEFEPAIQAIIRAKKIGCKNEESIPIYTCMRWDGASQKYIVTQEVVETKVGQEFRVTEENNPFIILVWERLYGENYGRGLLETIQGDLFVYQFLSKAIAKGCALMSEVKFLVRRGSASTPAEHARAESGEYIYGEEGDIHVVQLEKYGDYQTVSSVMEVYARRIGQAFLMSSATRRDAERVTTVEIRQDAMELETTLGGTYSQIASSGQLPYARLLLRRTKFKLDFTDIMPIIVTGLEALGKAGELDKLAQFSEMMAVPNSWSPAAQDRIKWSDYMVMIASNLNMETPWLMTEAEYAQKVQEQQKQAQQRAAMEAMQKAAPQMMKE